MQRYAVECSIPAEACIPSTGKSFVVLFHFLLLSGENRKGLKSKFDLRVPEDWQNKWKNGPKKDAAGAKRCASFLLLPPCTEDREKYCYHFA